MRLGTLRCLAWIAPPEGTALAAPLVHDPSAEVRAEAAAAIGQLGHEDAPMLLFELLGDESELIQESAMEGLARMSPPRVLPLLLQALASGDTDSRVRAAQIVIGERREQVVQGVIAQSHGPPYLGDDGELGIIHAV